MLRALGDTTWEGDKKTLGTFRKGFVELIGRYGASTNTFYGFIPHWKQVGVVRYTALQLAVR